MYSKFLNISTEKQERVLNAAMKEFAQKGYDLASTNEMIKDAEISKGLLFHYFKNKKQLFLYLYDYCADLTLKETYEKLDLSVTDIFSRIEQMAKFKMQILGKHPDMFCFFETAYMETSGEVKKELDQRNKELIDDSTIKIFEGINTSKFKEGIDIEKAINLIIWTLEGFGKSELAKAKALSAEPIDYEAMFAKSDVYINLLKQCIYK
ncbi:MAG: TetR/AcrR family transcriptional regulator [Gorillibacterium sp.]|nr:TetR/AcrR family transcriptional regulator [Gorillibacterium sp.]